MRDVTIEPVESMNELCGRLVLAMRIGKRPDASFFLLGDNRLPLDWSWFCDLWTQLPMLDLRSGDRLPDGERNCQCDSHADTGLSIWEPHLASPLIAVGK